VADVEIKIKNNIAEFDLNFNFYDYPTILETANEFTESCWIGMNGSSDGNFINMTIEPKDSSDSVSLALNSFFNYMLGIMNRKIKGFVVA